MTEKVWYVEGEHPFCPNIRMSVHATKAGADERAAENLRLIIADLKNETSEDLSSLPGPTADNWHDVYTQCLALFDSQDQNFRVHVIELELWP